MRIRASLALLLSVTGCTTTHTLPKAELARLDGWVGQETTLLQDIGSTLRNERKDIRRLRAGIRYCWAPASSLALPRRSSSWDWRWAAEAVVATTTIDRLPSRLPS
jgi:hypothetical protein